MKESASVIPTRAGECSFPYGSACTNKRAKLPAASWREHQDTRGWASNEHRLPASVSASDFYLVTYDVPDDRRRQMIARCLESIGERVHYSVFEAYLNPKEMQKLLKRMEKIMVMEEDSLRIYLLCAGCRPKVRTLGIGKVTEPPQVIIV